MGLPSLEHQIEFVDTIVIVRASKTAGKAATYYIDEVIKSRSGSIHPNTVLNADLTIFELLGYSIDDGQLAIAFLAEKADGFNSIDLLPVKDGFFEYGRDDKSMHRTMALNEFRQLVIALSL